ncbi:DUF1206 domain-containing protein [Flocculibacter collagenilyticus]|uniref:DUF1206 domain-containing protein n=1 Tax=Flocculibacter collagenilyticus TaxID=2744479 RepID=UPI0018F556C4|nr:DUF1206 domain-containing protein [Flocculibacter collagenilyticus]
MNSNASWITFVARAGYGAKCVVYSILGLFTILAAYGSASTEDVSKENVFKEILSQPFGRLLLTILATCLFCYTSWRWIQGLLNPEGLENNKPKAIFTRAFYFISGLLYASIGILAVNMLLGSNDKNSSTSQSMAGRLMQEAWGQWLVAALGGVIVIFALLQCKHAFKVDFMDKFVTDDMSSHEKNITRKVGILGFGARGLVYCIVGGFFIQAAILHDPNHAGGLKEALDTLLAQPYGIWLLGLTGSGLLAFGIFCGFEARYRKT